MVTFLRAQALQHAVAQQGSLTALCIRPWQRGQHRSLGRPITSENVDFNVDLTVMPEPLNLNLFYSLKTATASFRVCVSAGPDWAGVIAGKLSAGECA